MGAYVAVGAVGATLWWIGLAVVVLVVVPVVLLVATTLVRTIAEIGRYAVDVRDHAAALGERLGETAPLADTARVAATVGEQLRRHADALPRDGGGT